MQLNQSQLTEARNWINDCLTGDEDFDNASELSDREVQNIIKRYYEGGINQFILDGND